jgi:aryl-alcohol dehydrogenase-like predicted oxidoreductase
LRNPHVSTAITGASKPVQLKENMQAGEVAQKLDINVQTAIEEVLKNNPG